MTLNLETLTCANCSTEWERERKRGVKPKTCPGCTTISPSAIAAIIAYKAWVKLDAWLFAQFKTGELDRADYLELKSDNVMPDYDSLPDSDTWKLAETLNLV